MPKSKRELAHLNVEALKLRHPENGMIKVNLSMACGDRDFIDRALEGQSARGGGLRATFLAEAGVVLAAALMFEPFHRGMDGLWPNGISPAMLSKFGYHLARLAKNADYLLIAFGYIVSGMNKLINEKADKERRQQNNGQNA